ncbi:branched-chain amino acid transporter permease [Actinomadura kijaniata]|uniref:branched-chain amino acid transporter permease n=1 Tax=Actinomadura kijaniata TaxID=46161 RepID=UPI000832224A|nr:AzlD domain-containing protein [Actinomadura kijaniata]
MPDTPYLVAVLAIVFTITLALRAVPFAVLRALGASATVRRLSVWMPVGILVILAATTLHGAATEPAAGPRAMPYALLAVAVTAGVHLAFGRRTIWSVGIGTAVYVVLVNVL